MARRGEQARSPVCTAAAAASASRRPPQLALSGGQQSFWQRSRDRPARSQLPGPALRPCPAQTALCRCSPEAPAGPRLAAMGQCLSSVGGDAPEVYRVSCAELTRAAGRPWLSPRPLPHSARAPRPDRRAAGRSRAAWPTAWPPSATAPSLAAAAWASWAATPRRCARVLRGESLHAQLALHATRLAGRRQPT